MKAKRILSLFALIAVTAMLSVSVPVVSFGADGAALELFVSADGDDGNDGTKSAPFATVEAARDAIRALKSSSGLPDGGITVHIAEGTYFVSSPIEFTAEDSGTEACPIKYVGDGKVLLSGGYFLNPSDFRPITDESVKERLDENVRDTVLEYDLSILSEAGVDWGENYQYHMADREYPFEHQFYINGTNYILARYPNKADGFIRIDESEADGQSDQIFYLTAKQNMFDAIADWDFENQFVLMGGYMCDCYTYMESPAWSIADRGDGKVWLEVQKEDGNPEKKINPNGRIYLHNALEALDTEGEYYIEKAKRKLYIYPCGNFDEAEIAIPNNTGDAIIVSDADYVTFDSIEIAFSRNDGIRLTGDNVSVLNCTVRNAYGNGIYVRGDGISVDYCVIHDIGLSGIDIVTGTQHVLPEKISVISNCEIYEWSQRDTWIRMGVNPGGTSCGLLITNNEIHDGGVAIGFGKENTTIQYNLIYNACTEQWDQGAIYSAGNYENDHITVYCNYIYNCGAEGIYPDTCASYMTYSHNIIVNVGTLGETNHVNGDGIVIPGRDGKVTNNIIINTRRSTISNPMSPISQAQKQKSFDYLKYWTDAMKSGVYLQPEMKLMFSGKTLLDPVTGDWSADNPNTRGYTVVRNNVFYSVSSKYSTDMDHFTEGWITEGAEVSNNYVAETDPGFRDIHGDLTDPTNLILDDNSVIYSELPGFERIPVEKIGIGNIDN